MAVVFIISCVEPLLIVPPLTLSPIPFFTGRDSPVKLLSSTVLSPSITTPSQGTLSPVLTDTVDPTFTDDAGRTTISFVIGLIKLARSGRILTIADRAFVALVMAKLSRYSEGTSS